MNRMLISSTITDIKKIKNMGRELNEFLAKLDDCFSRKEPRENQRIYIKGQLSDLL
jgi:hypothetical protein